MTRCLLLAILAGSPVLAQTTGEPVTLKIEVENHVLYRGNVSDPARLGKEPGPITATEQLPFVSGINVGDIVAINGTPVRGVWSSSYTHTTPYRIAPQPGQFAATVDAGATFFCTWQIFAMDGTFLGTLRDSGAAGAHAVSGAVGGFFGLTGVHTAMGVGATTPTRIATTAEDPANRRRSGGGKGVVTFYLYPGIRPGVQMLASGPAIFHEDWTPVNAANPARPGELLIAGAVGLGPVKPNLDIPPGAVPFTASPLQEVNSPVSLTVNGREVPVLNKVGWPGQTGLYRVDFQMPADAAPGSAAVQLTSMWVSGPAVSIPVAAR